MSSVANHAAKALARLLSQYRGRPRFEGLVSAIGAEIQAIEDATGTMTNSLLAFLNAEGAQLDRIGTIVAQPRNGLDDSAYRARIAVRIAVNFSAGQMEDIINIAALYMAAVGNPLQVIVSEHFPAAMVVRLANYFPAAVIYVGELVGLLREAKGAGVRLDLEYQTATNATVFQYDASAGHGWDQAHYATVI